MFFGEEYPVFLLFLDLEYYDRRWSHLAVSDGGLKKIDEQSRKVHPVAEAPAAFASFVKVVDKLSLGKVVVDLPSLDVSFESCFCCGQAGTGLAVAFVVLGFVVSLCVRCAENAQA